MDANFYRMYPEYKFAVVKIQSEILSFQELEQLNYNYKIDVNYSNIHYLLIEIDKKCRLSFSIKELERLSDIYNTEYQVNNHKVIVWLVSHPLLTALIHLFVLQTKDNSKYCSTLGKAYDLFNIPIDFNKFEELIKGM